jgi:hypothetical protein
VKQFDDFQTGLNFVALESGCEEIKKRTVLGTKAYCANLKIFNPLSRELNAICYLLILLAHDFLHVSRIRVNHLAPEFYI